MRQICRVCWSAYVHAHGRCAACRAYFVKHGEERPWSLIGRHNALREEKLAERDMARRVLAR
jgi:hypothetical protein